MLRIWFNRTYATTVHTIALLRDNPDGRAVRIHGTHADPSSPVLGACDVSEPEPEPEVVGAAYVGWALDFCARHRIQVFVPRLHSESIAAARSAFTAAGVALVAGPARAAALLEDKAAAYADASLAGLAVPPHRVVRTGAELGSAFDELRAAYGEVCLKPVTGVGGQGFRRLTSRGPDLAAILDVFGPDLPVADAVRALDERLAAGGVVPPLMVLPWLPGPEVSLDCLGDDDGRLLACVARTKIGRRRLLLDDAAATDVARTIVARHRLASLSNTQVRYWARPGLETEPRPYLLETNVRMSGGLYQTALAGINLPWAAVLLALGESVELATPRLGVGFTTVSGIAAVRD